MAQLRRDLYICEAKLSGAKNVTLPMLRQKIDDADASAAQAQADCLRACNALDTEIRTRTALEAEHGAMERELHDAQEEADAGRHTWQKLCYAVDCHEEQRAAYLELQDTAAAIAAERDEALYDLDAALSDLDAAEERFEQLQAAAADELRARDADRACLLAATHGLLDMRDADLGRLRAELAGSQAELADSRARVARRDAQLAALAQGGLSAHGRGLVDELIRAAGTLTRQKALYRAAFGAAQLELNYRAGAVPGCETPAERGQRLARLQTAAVADIQQEMDGKPAPVDERSDEEVVQGFMAELWALQRGSAAKCSAGTAPGCSSSADVTAAGGSQQVQPAKAGEPLPASPAKGHVAADPLQPTTPPLLIPRRCTADGSSDTE